VQDILETVKAAFPQDKAMARIVDMYLCQKYTGKKLKGIGLPSGIGESGVSPSCRRVAQKFEKDKKLNKKIDRIEKQLYAWNEGLTPVFCQRRRIILYTADYAIS
jgi:hypothetical protein